MSETTINGLEDVRADDAVTLSCGACGHDTDATTMRDYVRGIGAPCWSCGTAPDVRHAHRHDDFGTAGRAFLAARFGVRA